MRKRLTRAAVVYVSAQVLCLSALAVLGDILFFKSDFESACLFLAVLSLPLFLLLLVFRSVPFEKVLATLLLSDFFFFLGSFLNESFGLTVALKRFTGLALPLWPVDAASLALWLLVFGYLYRRLNSKRHAAILQRCAKLAMIAAPASIAIAVYAWIAASPASLAMPRHMVLVVIDGWPSEFISLNDPGVFPKARSFTNVHTNATWTSSAFAALYSGQLKHTYAITETPHFSKRFVSEQAADKNLLTLLQARGVRTRGFVSHRSAMPEGCGSHQSDYKGLRSIFIPVRFSWLLNRLRLNYFLFLKGATPRKASVRPPKALTQDHGDSTEDNSLLKNLLPEIKDIKEFPQSFMVVHINWEDLAKIDSPDLIPPGPILDRLKKNNYVVEKEDEPLLLKVHKKQAQRSRIAYARIEDFIHAIEVQGLLKDSLVVLTADHGSMSSRNKLWYGYHPDEEVTRIPVVMFGDVVPGKDHRLFETVDITRTILDYFEAGATLLDRTLSLLGPGHKRFTTTLTLYSSTREELFLVLYKDNLKYMLNLHYGGDGRILKQKVKGFNVATIAQGNSLIEEIKEELQQALNEFQLQHLRLKIGK